MKALISTMIVPTSLVFVRRLKEMGYQVTAVDSVADSYGLFSNCVDKRIVLPSLRYQPLAYAAGIIAELQQEQYDIYVPCLECAFLMSFFHAEISKYTNMISMPYHIIKKVHNKKELLSLARQAQASLPPPTFVPQSLSQAELICQEIDYPIIIKPQSASNAVGQVLVPQHQNVFEKYQEVYQQNPGELPLIQKYIKGYLLSSVNLAHQGEIIGSTSFKSLRTFPLEGGTSCYRVTHNNHKVLNSDRLLIKHLNWTGFISFDYMFEENTKEIYLIDCNPRPAPGLILGHYAAVDLVGAYTDLLLNKKIRPLNRQRENVYGKMQFLDLGWFLFGLRDKKKSFSEKVNHLKKWRKKEKHCYDILDFKDLKPFLYLYLFIGKRFFKLLSPQAGEIFLEHAFFDHELFEEQLAKLKQEKGVIDLTMVGY